MPPGQVIVQPGVLGNVGERVQALAPAHRYAVVTDENVGLLYAEKVRRSFGDALVDVFATPAGEVSKTRESWARITDAMLAAGFGRDSTIVALGGGVVGDLAGFVAATFMRGVPYVQAPTTLLAMIDASIGGKTGVDTPAGKNLVGAFHRPSAVVVDPETLSTLPRSQLRSGLAEALKHGAIADARYFQQVVDALPVLLGPEGSTSAEMTALIARSIEIKQEVVARDEREGGIRKILNFGHTLGHAIELLSGYTLLHGEAVAIGMSLEAGLAERAGIAEGGTAARVAEACSRAGLPVKRPGSMRAEAVLSATRGDKKARGGAVEYALPLRIGAMAGERDGWAVRVEDELVLEALA